MHACSRAEDMALTSKSSEPMPIAVYALSIGALGIGTTEFVIMGLLVELAKDLGITIGTAGYVVTAYALGVVLGAPLITPLLAGFPRRLALTGLMALFTLGNLASALSPSMTALLIARVVTAFAHASYFGIGSVVASDIAPPSKRSTAISTMFLGATVANVLGVPLGTLVGQEYGWRASFIAVSALGVIATLTTYAFVPSLDHDKRDAPSLRSEIRALRQSAVLRALAITTFGFSGTFVVFTYIAPMLIDLAGIEERFVSPVLFLFGGGMIAGNWIGGRLADTRPDLSLRITLVALAVVLATCSVAMTSQVSACVAVFLLGAAMFATISPLQTNIIRVAFDAPTMAASCNIAAFNLGNALGAWIGGELIDHGYSLKLIPIAATVLTGVGLTLSLLKGRPPADKGSLSTPTNLA
ncbi:MFS transporter [Methylobacterium radiotolerans]|uniref:MFS transporter n=1 Tax=Methylobacterium radiotolerans TaxID=31998 RepID=UPI001FD8B306|nr:MFS transporter [Methylobacterium radiotolerans]